MVEYFDYCMEAIRKKKADTANWLNRGGSSTSLEYITLPITLKV